MKAKQNALKEIAKIADQHSLSRWEVIAALGSNDKSSSIITKLLAYLGSIFIVAGLMLYTALSWETLISPMRVLITFGSGILLYITSIVLLKEQKYHKAVTPLIMLSTFFVLVGLYVIKREYFESLDIHLFNAFIFSFMLALQLVPFLKFARHTFIFNTLVFVAALAFNTLDGLDIAFYYSSIAVGALLMSLAILLHFKLNDLIAAFWLLIGSGLFLSGSYELLEKQSYSEAFIIAPIAIVWLSTFLKSRTLLFTGAFSLFAYIMHYTSTYFADSFGWALSLLVVGAALFAISFAVFKLQSKFKQGK